MTTIAGADLVLHQARFDKALADHLTHLSATPKSKERRQHSLLKETNLHLGTCCRWNAHRGFGFIASDARLDGVDEDKDVYSHASKLPKGVTALEAGQRVEFVLVPARLPGKQPQARVLRIIAGAEAA